ncbi:2263_t:CDS:2, partial [Acaulospora colombiana]
KEDLPKDIDEMALLMTYLVENNLTLDSDDDSPQPDVGQGFSSNNDYAQVDTHGKEEGILELFKQLKSFNFKCGSGDVNETALDYSDPEEPKIAIAYIANSDPNYNSMGNLQFCDVLNGELEGDGKMHIWDLKSRKTTIGITKEKDANVISISPNDRYIALGGISNTVYVFDRRNMKKCLHSLEHDDPKDGLPHDGVMSLQWIPDSSILLSGGNDSTVRVWNVDAAIKNTPLLYRFENHDSPVTSIRISPDLQFMSVGVSTGKVYVYTTKEIYIQRGNCLKYL